MQKLSELINLSPEIVFLDQGFVNVLNINYYEKHDLFIVIHYLWGGKELINFGSTQETEAAVLKLEKAFKESYGYENSRRIS